MERVARFRVERTLCANTFLKFFVVVFSDAESSFKGIQTPAYRLCRLHGKDAAAATILHQLRCRLCSSLCS